MRHLSLLAAAAFAAVSPASAQPAAPAPDYYEGFDWLCLPGRADVCSTPLATTALNPNGYGSTGRSDGRQGPAARLLLCLPDGLPRPGMNSDLNRREERPPAGAIRALRRRLPDLRAASIAR